VSGLILALVIGFLLGILLMIFLVAGREEQELLDRVEKTELSNGRPSRASGNETRGQKTRPKDSSQRRLIRPKRVER
jgi:hypothetical protein